MDYLDDMHEDLMQTFRKVVMESEGEMKIETICEKTVTRPARRFYISPLQAYKVVSRMRKGDMKCLERMPPYRKDMFREIYRLVEQYMMRYEYATRPLLFVVAHVISNRAPRFYISAESMRRLYYNRKRRKRL